MSAARAAMTASRHSRGTLARSLRRPCVLSRHLGARRQSSQVVPVGEDAVFERRRARPLSIASDVRLYQSDIDIQEVVSSSGRRCKLGAGLASAGFAAILATVAASAPPAMFVVLVGGAAANSYTIAVVAQRMIEKLADRHVDRLTVLPTEDQAGAGADAEGQESGAASLLIGAATVEERLAATPELRLHIRTASADRWLTLVDAPEEERLEPDGRAPFSDLWGRLGLLHADSEEGMSADQALLTAVMSTPKVAADERVELRAADGSTTAVSRPNMLLSDVTRADVEQAEKLTSGEPPADVIERYSRRAVWGGGSVVAAAGLFLAGEKAKGPDGVPRWNNLIYLPDL